MSEMLNIKHFLQNTEDMPFFCLSPLLPDAAPENPVTLIAVGGDGTIQEVLSGVHDLSCITFGYIPTGSGNDFCRGMKLPMAPPRHLI